MRYQYNSLGFNQYYNNKFFSPGVKSLIIINIIIFIIVEISGFKGLFFKSFGLVPNDVVFNYKVWQPGTYLFLHGGFLHIFFNMFVLWMFGTELERIWGKNKFFKFYFFSGIGAGIITVLFSINSIIPTVGASGAIYGLLVAYGLKYPYRTVLLYGLFPIQIRYMVATLAIISFVASIMDNGSNINHLTHLSGMILGLVYIKNDFKWFKIKFIKKRNLTLKKKNKYYNVDIILDKLNDSGWDSLTKDEINLLYKSSKGFINNKSKNLKN